MTHSSSQSTSLLCRAIKKKSHANRILKKPPPCLTTKQIRQEKGFLTRAQMSIVRNTNFLISYLTIQGFLIQWREKVQGIFKSPSVFLQGVGHPVCFACSPSFAPGCTDWHCQQSTAALNNTITAGTQREEGSSAAVSSQNITTLELFQLPAQAERSRNVVVVTDHVHGGLFIKHVGAQAEN